jgi:hypothetical protein
MNSLTITSGDDGYSELTCGDVAFWAEYDDISDFIFMDGDVIDFHESDVIDCLEPDTEYSIDLDFVKEVYRLVNGHDDWTINPETGTYVIEKLSVLLKDLDHDTDFVKECKKQQELLSCFK